MSSVRPPLEPLLRAPQKALKEWAVVCRALRAGRQAVLLRKGGIIEETRHFELIERRFLLFPTFEHQDLDSVRDDYRGWFRESLDEQPPADIVRMDAWAEVADLFLTFDLDAVLSLRDHYAWSDDYVRMRMAYKPRKPMNVVVVRAHALPSTVEIANLDHFAGCKSWVPLDAGVPLDGSAPAVDDATHERRAGAIADALRGAEHVAV